MVRLTVTAPDELIVRLREIARDEGTSLAEVMREALELRAAGASYRYALAPVEREPFAATG